MNKRLIIFSLVGFTCLITIFGYFVTQTSKKKTPMVKTPSPSPVVQEKRLVWDDPAGFTFTYDSTLDVNPHPEDDENYAHVELTKPGQTGNIIVWASDTLAKTPSEWVKGQKRFAKASLLDTTLGGVSAIKVNGIQTSGNMMIGTISDGLVFYIDASASQSAFLTAEFGRISDSFIFKPQDTPQTSSSDSSGDGTTYDEEETVQ